MSAAVPPNSAVVAETVRHDTTLIKGVRILETLANTPEPLGLTAIARASNLQKSNAHRILRTLSHLKLVTQEPETGRYLLTLTLWELGNKVINRSQIRRAARPFLRALHQETTENVYLVVLDEMDVLYIDAIDATFPLQIGMVAGARAPALFPATGKALLAHQPNLEDILRYYESTIPKAANLDSKALSEEFAEIRSRGFSVSVSGWTNGMTSIAAPIIDRKKRAIAAIGVGFPTESVEAERITECSKAVRSAAVRIAETLGEQGE